MPLRERDCINGGRLVMLSETVHWKGPYDEYNKDVDYYGVALYLALLRARS
jgi:hypothetical protein